MAMKTRAFPPWRALGAPKWERAMECEGAPFAHRWLGEGLLVGPYNDGFVLFWANQGDDGAYLTFFLACGNLSDSHPRR